MSLIPPQGCTSAIPSTAPRALRRTRRQQTWPTTAPWTTATPTTATAAKVTSGESELSTDTGGICNDSFSDLVHNQGNEHYKNGKWERLTGKGKRNRKEEWGKRKRTGGNMTKEAREGSGRQPCARSVPSPLVPSCENFVEFVVFGKCPPRIVEMNDLGVLC
jgi:hypothetical protein